GSSPCGTQGRSGRRPRSGHVVEAVLGARGAEGRLRLRGAFRRSPGPRPRRQDSAKATGPRCRGRALRARPRRRNAQLAGRFADSAARRLAAGRAGRPLRPAGRLHAQRGGVRRPRLAHHRRRHRSAVPAGRPRARGEGHALRPRGATHGLVHARGPPLRGGLLGRGRPHRALARVRGRAPLGGGVGHRPELSAAAAEAQLSRVAAPREGSAAPARGCGHEDRACREACRARRSRGGRRLIRWMSAGVARSRSMDFVGMTCSGGHRPSQDFLFNSYLTQHTAQPMAYNAARAR
ncbi:unnamed protein product, partial [Prorocentrum cordatum]